MIKTTTTSRLTALSDFDLYLLIAAGWSPLIVTAVATIYYTFKYYL